jgi:hypothetical protein
LANVPPGQPIAPGIATGNTYPQWGVGGGTPGSSAGWKIVEATNESQKLSYANQGYLVWFSSDAAAQSFLQTEESPILSGEPQNAIPGLSQIGDFFGALTQSSTWIRVAKVAVGGLLLVIGLVHITGADNALASAARKVPLPV